MLAHGEHIQSHLLGVLGQQHGLLNRLLRRTTRPVIGGSRIIRAPPSPGVV